MSVWNRFGEFISQVTTEAFEAVVEAIRTVFEGEPEVRRQVGFSVSMIALSAKMAKADGIVTEDEVRAFQAIFEIPEKEFNNVSRLYNIAKQDVAGFEAYAHKVKRLFTDEQQILTDVLDGLFHIAKADGLYHENEMAVMDHVAEIFEIENRAYARIRARHIEPEGGNPYVFLEADPKWDDAKLKSHYRSLVRETHPDRMMARGIPQEFIAIANERLADINRAWDQVKLERGL